MLVAFLIILYIWDEIKVETQHKQDAENRDIPSKLTDEDARLTCSSLETTPLRILSRNFLRFFFQQMDTAISPRQRCE
jgi:hypothetical protein